MSNKYRNTLKIEFAFVISFCLSVKITNGLQSFSLLGIHCVLKNFFLSFLKKKVILLRELAEMCHAGIDRFSFWLMVVSMFTVSLSPCVLEDKAHQYIHYSYKPCSISKSWRWHSNKAHLLYYSTVAWLFLYFLIN